MRSLLPLSKVQDRGWINPTDDLDALESSVAQFLGLQSLDGKPDFAPVARRADASEPVTLCQTAWLARIRQVASDLSIDGFSTRKLRELAPEIPRIREPGPEQLGSVVGQLAECGVAVVFVEGRRGGKLDGAVTVLPDGRPVVGLTTRGDRFDALLSTLMHECAHLALGHLERDSKSIVDDELTTAASDDSREVEAIEQAAAWLFPGGFEVESHSAQAVAGAAARYRVHPCALIGQIQLDTGNFNFMRSKIPKVRRSLTNAGLLLT